MSNELHIDGTLNVQIVSIPLDELIQSLKKHDTDVVISSMTSIKEREEKHKIRFTEGYYTSHQISISNKIYDEFPQALSGKRVGVVNNTTNESVARFLESQFSQFIFEIDSTYNSYDDLYEALEQNKIDFALVDDVLIGDESGKQFHRFGETLDNYLMPFYKNVFGRPAEMYAIAVAQEPSTKEVLAVTNKILQSKEGEEKRKALTNSWVQRK